MTERKQEMTAEEIEKAKKAYGIVKIALISNKNGSINKKNSFSEKRHGDQFSKLVVQARDQMRAGRNCGEREKKGRVGVCSCVLFRGED